MAGGAKETLMQLKREYSLLSEEVDFTLDQKVELEEKIRSLRERHSALRRRVVMENVKLLIAILNPFVSWNDKFLTKKERLSLPEKNIYVSRHSIAVRECVNNWWTYWGVWRESLFLGIIIISIIFGSSA